jgi:hypothetical protein
VVVEAACLVAYLADNGESNLLVLILLMNQQME